MNREQFIEFYKEEKHLQICWEYYIENFKPSITIKNPIPPDLFSHHFQNFASFTKFSLESVLNYYYDKFKINILKSTSGEIIKLL